MQINNPAKPRPNRQPPFSYPIRLGGQPVSPEVARQMEASRLAFLHSQPTDHGLINDPEIAALRHQVEFLRHQIELLRRQPPNTPPTASPDPADTLTQQVEALFAKYRSRS